MTADSKFPLSIISMMKSTSGKFALAGPMKLEIGRLEILQNRMGNGIRQR
jgi:hypothetical protein